MSNIKFEDLIGRTGILCAASDLTFRIGNLTFQAIEDESDGYRSSLSELKIVDNIRPTFQENVSIEADDDYFYIRSTVTDKIIITVGTDYADDYYPCFAFRYDPTKATIYNYNKYRIEPDKYPALFKKLDWWEDRKVEDMPTHIKSIKSGRTFEVIDYSLDYNEVEYWLATGEEQVSELTNFIPA